MSVTGRVTLRDIAARLGVSHVTVSLALKNHPDISQSRRQEVQAMAREMGYRPDPALASLMVYRQSRRNVSISSSIAWINSSSGSEESGEIEAYRYGVKETAESFGYHLDELTWPEDRTPERFEKILLNRNIRGILLPPYRNEPDWGNFHWENFSVVRFGLSASSRDSHVVSGDQTRMVALALQSMHDLGYRKVGLVLPKDLDARLGHSFAGGYYAAQLGLGLKSRIPMLATSEEALERFPEKSLADFETWFLEHRPDAILTATAHTVAMAGKLNLSIPGEVGMAGLSLSGIPLSAGIDQNPLEVGRTAAETLINLINHNDRGRPASPRRILVECLWHDGDSLPPKLQREQFD